MRTSCAQRAHTAGAANMVHDTEADVTAETGKSLPELQLTGATEEWRRGDSNPRRTETEPLQEHDNSATERSDKPVKDSSDKQSHDTSEQFQTLPQHKLGAHLVRGGDVDPDLARIAEAWPTLPDHVKTRIKDLIYKHSTEGKAHGGKEEED